MAESSMMRYLAILAACLISASPLTPATADQKSSLPVPSDSTNTGQAKASLLRMADHLSKVQNFSVTLDATYDVVQASGQKIEFGEVRQILLNRPDDMRIDLEKRDGSKEQVLFNGDTLTLFNPGQNIFASLTRPGSVDDTIYYIIMELQMRVPLSLLLATTLPEEMEKRVTEVALVDDETIDGKAAQHLAARTDDLDFQIWITIGNEPVPLRVVLTYKKAAGQPQFAASLSNWNFHPKVDPSAFTFVPPAGSESVAFMVPATGNAGGSRLRR
jgi:hypothetical protein